MKKILFALTTACLTSCNQFVDNANKAASADSLKTNFENKNSGLSQEILKEIKKYYQQKYGTEARIDEENTDSLSCITYHSISNEKDGTNSFRIAIYIAKNDSKFLFGANPIISGDLNNDRFNDLVVNVHTEGGGEGSNGIWWNDIFVFLNQNGKYRLTTIKKDTELVDCDEGHFLISKIENGYLIGNSSCYSKTDALCCPSLNYLTKSKLQNDKLEFVSKTKL